MELKNERMRICLLIVLMCLRLLAQAQAYKCKQRIGVTRQTIAAIEAGKYSPSLEAAFRIAQVFNVPLGEVFPWDAKAGH